jgi:hypothetical protein
MAPPLTNRPHVPTAILCCTRPLRLQSYTEWLRPPLLAWHVGAAYPYATTQLARFLLRRALPQNGAGAEFCARWVPYGRYLGHGMLYAVWALCLVLSWLRPHEPAFRRDAFTVQ